ncbi:MAG: uroporphyrinogen decarboxylase [Actinomycetota bacterium]
MRYLDRYMACDSQNDRFLRACRREPVDTTPIWMMRQAGRSLPAYRQLREKYSFKQVAGSPELCARVSLMPLDELDVDAAIIFADIMTPVACLGMDYEIIEGTGPVVADPVRSVDQIRRLPQIPAAEAVPALFEAMRICAAELESKVPLIGFAGAPFTLASYLVEGRPDRDLPRTKALMAEQPEVWHALMDKLSGVLAAYLHEQVRAGVQAFQLFDSWVGSLTPAEYKEFALPYTCAIFGRTAGLGVPRIHFGTGTSELLELMAEPEPEVIGVDWQVELDVAWERVGYHRAVQGNLDPKLLLAEPGVMTREALSILDKVGGRPGHIFNLGHGVLPNSPLDNLKLLVETVHEYPLS